MQHFKSFGMILCDLKSIFHADIKSDCSYFLSCKVFSQITFELKLPFFNRVNYFSSIKKYCVL